MSDGCEKLLFFVNALSCISVDVRSTNVYRFNIPCRSLRIVDPPPIPALLYPSGGARPSVATSARRVAIPCIRNPEREVRLWMSNVGDSAYLNLLMSVSMSDSDSVLRSITCWTKEAATEYAPVLEREFVQTVSQSSEDADL